MSNFYIQQYYFLYKAIYPTRKEWLYIGAVLSSGWQFSSILLS